MILLIEDNESILEGLELALKDNNYLVLKANNLKIAKEKITNDIELIVLDVSLPDGNGFDFYEDYIKDKNIPTVFLTARDSEEDIVKGLNLGADDYLTKPFSTK